MAPVRGSHQQRGRCHFSLSLRAGTGHEFFGRSEDKVSRVIGSIFESLLPFEGSLVSGSEILLYRQRVKYDQIKPTQM